jgi:Spy/CpxP family protein refolding chaperone
MGSNLKETIMKSSLKLSLLAGLLVTASVVYSQSPVDGRQCDHMMMGQPGTMQGQGMRHRGMGQMDPVKMQAMVEKRLATLKTQLKLTPTQEGNWAAFTTAMKPPADRQISMHPDQAELAKLTTPERIEKMKALHTQHMAEMSANMDRRGEATKAFYATLTPDQQKTFDASALQAYGSRAGKRANMPSK